MSKTKVCNGTGYFVVDETDPDNLRFYYELDYGSNCYGDVGLFYKNWVEFHSGGGICYIATVDNGVIYEDDPEFKQHAYTYDDIMRICNNHRDAVYMAMEDACGEHMEYLWDANYEDLYDEEE